MSNTKNSRDSTTIFYFLLHLWGQLTSSHSTTKTAFVSQILERLSREWLGDLGDDGRNRITELVEKRPDPDDLRGSVRESYVFRLPGRLGDGRIVRVGVELDWRDGWGGLVADGECELMN
ncbi:hypothetical protein [Phaffia rhodozyma]|uniref:Uncharacterized protein n=1 Tax=Phaffia rhodozyma TaxID=264483 RepID=A0A0F7SQE0_PHARH|nr:hypothetical protein [Phaffia rhodozyma]